MHKVLRILRVWIIKIVAGRMPVMLNYSAYRPGRETRPSIESMCAVIYVGNIGDAVLGLKMTLEDGLHSLNPGAILVPNTTLKQAGICS